MPRQFKKTKPLIYVFCEGESEQAYTDVLKEIFSDRVVIRRPSSTGIFEEAADVFAKNPRYKSNAEVTDEIWFFFDVEKKDVDKWDMRYKIINTLRKLRKDKKIRVRLLMTTACIEYWLMLHYKMFAPPLETVAHKESMKAQVVKKVPEYQKGDFDTIKKIAHNYSTAVVNAEKTIKNLVPQGLPSIDDTDERNKWLYTKCKTFSTVSEAIRFLESI